LNLGMYNENIYEDMIHFTLVLITSCFGVLYYNNLSLTNNQSSKVPKTITMYLTCEVNEFYIAKYQHAKLVNVLN